jgi:hypothetical protein
LVTSSAEEQLKTLPVWAKSISEFNELDLDDQVTLLRTSNYFFKIFLDQNIDKKKIRKNFNLSYLLIIYLAYLSLE